MPSEFARVSLTGHRAENQDRVEIVHEGPSTLMIVVDGMGGHTGGARASAVVTASLAWRFREAGQPLIDPQGFLIAALAASHDQVVGLGDGIAIEQRPRATCAACLIQDDSLYCAHIGDSRIYQIRGGEIIHRSRDHSHVELLLHEGLIEEADMKNHPMRNYVECCLGGDEPLPNMSIAPRRRLEHGDVVLLCSDGFWSGASEKALLGLGDPSAPLEPALIEIARLAVASNAPGSDNTSAVALRYGGGAA